MLSVVHCILTSNNEEHNTADILAVVHELTPQLIIPIHGMSDWENGARYTAINSFRVFVLEVITSITFEVFGGRFENLGFPMSTIQKFKFSNTNLSNYVSSIPSCCTNSLNIV